MKKLLLISVFIASLTALFGQGVLNEQSKTLFTDEQTFGGFLNNNGIGVDYRYGKYINAFSRRTYEVSFNYVKHPKEYKTVYLYEYYTRKFVYGKENFFWEIQGQIGNQHDIFRKYDYSSIAIRFNYSGGLSLGFLKPIYYEILTYNSTGYVITSETEILKFDPAIHLNNYGSTAAFSEGLNELKLIPGVTGKASISFEYSEKEPMVHALEAGIAFTVYPKDIKIMNTEDKQYFFFKMFLGYRFGSIIDISDAAQAKSRKTRREERQKAMEGQSPIFRF